MLCEGLDAVLWLAHWRHENTDEDLAQVWLLNCYWYTPVRTQSIYLTVFFPHISFIYLTSISGFPDSVVPSIIKPDISFQGSARWCFSGFKQTQNKLTLTDLPHIIQRVWVSRRICVSVSASEWTEGQRHTQMGRWVVQERSRCLKWPLLLPFIEPLAQTQRQGLAPKH